MKRKYHFEVWSYSERGFLFFRFNSESASIQQLNLISGDGVKMWVLLDGGRKLWHFIGKRKKPIQNNCKIQHCLDTLKEYNLAEYLYAERDKKNQMKQDINMAIEVLFGGEYFD